VLNFASKYLTAFMAKKVKRFGSDIVFPLIIMALLAAITLYLKQRYFNPPFVHYKEFGIDLPTNYDIHGIDVSRYQQDIDWKLVKEMQVKKINIGFAFIKATEGTSYVDEQFKENMESAKEAGMARGAYHFFIPSRSGKLQAANFIDIVKLKKGDLPPVLDVEQANGVAVADMQQRIAEWLTIVEKKYNVKPIIYSNADFYKTYLAGKFDDYPLWVAHYLVKDKPRINRNWLFWQHSERGQVSGIRTNVDFNVFNGDSSDFKDLLID
jgi:lysozyme